MWLALACTGAGVVSLYLGQDANWDLKNYHLYNPWAWVNGRYGFDLAPAQIQTFINPTLDLPLGAMVAANWAPRAIAVVQAVPAGVAAFMLLLLCRELFANMPTIRRRVAIVASLGIGLTGVAGGATIGNSMNEWPGAALVLAAIVLIVRALRTHSMRWQIAACAGLLAGLACCIRSIATCCRSSSLPVRR